MNRLVAIIASVFAVKCMAITVGADQPELYLPLIEGGKVALLTNHTGITSTGHIIDDMLDLEVELTGILTPEHGLRGTVDAGEEVKGGRDTRTGLTVVSMYGKNHMAAADSLVKASDIIVCDLQDVGARFYTYYITMMELMQSAAKYGKRFVVLDRPNPNGMIVDGPILERALYSGVGKIPVPVLHGATMGELALMICGEGWLGDNLTLLPEIVPVKDYTHSAFYHLPVAPSPNLNSDTAIALYPSLCFFEGTPVSVGRGTRAPFTMFGHPSFRSKWPAYSFTPQPRPGATKPMLSGEKCFGLDLASEDISQIHANGINLEYIIEAYNAWKKANPGKKFFKRFASLLFGTEKTVAQIEAGMSTAEIKESWQPGLGEYEKIRRKYLIYPL